MGNFTKFTVDEKVKRFLENVLDSETREEAIKISREAGIENPEFAEYNAKGSFHNGDGLSPASGIAVGNNGEIFLSDEFNHRIAIYGSDLAFKRFLGEQGTAEGQFRYPRGLAADADGNLYVADAWNHRVAVYGPELSLKGYIGRLGSGKGELDEPVDLVWTQNILAVVETSNHRVQLFDDRGNSLGTIGTRGSADEETQFSLFPVHPTVFNPPVFEYPSSIAADGGGNLYIADTNNHRIVKVDLAGRRDSAFKPTGLKYPVGVAVDGNGNIHVTQFGLAGVSVFSPEGALRHRYVPSDVETPVYISTHGSDAFLCSGVKAGVSVFSISPTAGNLFSAEDDFQRVLRISISDFAKGRWKEAIRALEELAQGEYPGAMDFADILPESDCRFPCPADNAHLSVNTEKIPRLLKQLAEKAWSEFESLLKEKIEVTDRVASLILKEEKNLLAGEQKNDKVLLERYRESKKILGISSRIKKVLHSFKKINEFWERLAYAGIHPEARTAHMRWLFENLLRLAGERGEWMAMAEKEAPALSFSSAPDERSDFFKNELRLNDSSYEFSVLWEMAGDSNRELAALVSKFGTEALPGINELIPFVIDLLARSPEYFPLRRNYFLAMERLFDATGGDFINTIVESTCDETTADHLGKEENIPPGTQGKVYHLFPALWSRTSIKSIKSPSGENWERITSFYHGEFNRFITENTPLKVENIRTWQAHPAAEKADPAQAAMIQRKGSLLRFHNLFQEKYMCNMMLEYLVRYAMFSLAGNTIGGDTLARTREALDDMIRKTSGEQAEAEIKMAGVNEELENLTDRTLKGRLLEEKGVLEMVLAYHEVLGTHLRIARTRICKPSEIPVRKWTFSGTGIHQRSLMRPAGLAHDRNGNLLVLSHWNGLIFRVDAKGSCLDTFAGFGNLDCQLKMPMDITVADDGTCLVVDYPKRELALFSEDAGFIRRIPLEGIGDKHPYCARIDSAGRIFVSFMDGSGISIYDFNGKMLGDLGTTPLNGIEGILGFCIKKDRIMAGGNGKFIAATLDGSIANTFTAGEAEFGRLTSLDEDGAGNIWAVDHANNILLKMDHATGTISKVDTPFAQSLAKVAASANETIVVTDYIANSVIALTSS